MLSHREVLSKSYQDKKDYSNIFENKLLEHISIISSKSFSQKGVFTVLVTLLVHKIIDPKQDIRNHQANMNGGFSGRSIDTKYITPYIKEIGLPSMAESGWLTRSLEQPYPYNLTYNGKISGKGVKEAFLSILDAVEKNSSIAENILKHLLYHVDILSKSKKIQIIRLEKSDKLTISQIINFLDKQFSYNYGTFGGSKIPVIAFQAIYTIIVNELKRYEGCELKKLGSHTASDRTSKCAGDIEIIKNNNLLEAVEVKLDKPIDEHMIRIATQKIYEYNPRRYYILSNAEFIDQENNNKLIEEVKKEHGCQIIVNGLLPTIKYYLRLIESLDEFLHIYFLMIEEDNELKKIHKDICNDLIKEYL